MNRTTTQAFQVSRYPAAPLKTICIRLMLAGVIISSMQTVYADQVCATAPCTVSDGAAHTLDSTNLSASDSAAILTVTGTGTSLAGTDVTVTNTGMGAAVSVTAGSSVTLAGSTVNTTGFGDAVFVSAAGSSATSVMIEDNSQIGTATSTGIAIDDDADAQVTLDHSTAQSANGLTTFEVNGGATATIQNGSTVSNTGGLSAVYVNNDSNVSFDASSATANSGETVDVEGGAGIRITGRSSVTNTGTGTGVYTTDAGSSATINNSQIDTTSGTGRAIDVEAASNVTLDSSTASSQNSSATFYVNGSTAAIQNGSNVTNTGSGAGLAYMLQSLHRSPGHCEAAIEIIARSAIDALRQDQGTPPHWGGLAGALGKRADHPACISAMAELAQAFLRRSAARGGLKHFNSQVLANLLLGFSKLPETGGPARGQSWGHPPSNATQDLQAAVSIAREVLARPLKELELLDLRQLLNGFSKWPENLVCKKTALALAGEVHLRLDSGAAAPYDDLDWTLIANACGKWPGDASSEALTATVARRFCVRSNQYKRSRKPQGNTKSPAGVSMIGSPSIWRQAAA